MSDLKLPEDFEYPNLVRPWVCFDTETTGLTQWDSVLQLTAIDFTGKVVDEYFTAYKRKTWKKAMAVHHITPEMVAGKPTLRERRIEFRDMFKQYPIVVGFNVGYDVRAVAFNTFHHIEYYSGIIDVLKLWRNYKKKHNIKTENDKLVTASKYFGWDYTEFAHNALADVYATIYVLQKIIDSDEEIYFECLNIQKTYKTNNSTKNNTKKSVVKKEKSSPKQFSIDDFDEENPF